jgi:hypothetical protein
VGRADDGPFAFDLVDATKKELAEVSGLLDLTEDGFDDVFAEPVSTSVTTLPDPAAHGPHAWAAFRAVTGFAGAPRRHVAPYRPLDETFEVGLGTEAVI